MPRWSFITNHADVLLHLAADPNLRVRDLALRVGLTERATQHILNDLVEEGYITRIRVGNRNRYEVHPDVGMRRPIVQQREIRGLLALLTGTPVLGSEAAEPGGSDGASGS